MEIALLFAFPVLDDLVGETALVHKCFGPSNPQVPARLMSRRVNALASATRPFLAP
jgi:hypothetical protein